MTNPIIEGLHREVETAPHRVAVTWQGHNYTYADLDALIQTRTADLLSEGCRPGDVVAVEAVRGLDTVVDIAALWSIGTPVLVFPAASQQPLIDGMVARSHAAAVLRPPGKPPQWVEAASSGQLDLDAIILILPTSGSTGKPKLVPLSDQAVRRFVTWAEQEFGLSKRHTLSFAPLNFDLSLFELWSVLASGGRAELVSDADAQNPTALRALLRHTDIDLIQGVPFVYKSLATPIDEDPLRLDRVRDVITTGSSVEKETRLLMAEVFPRAKFHNVYGSTETNNSFIASFGAAEFLTLDQLPIGLPLPGVSAAIQGSTGAPVAGPGTGQLLVRTPFMMSGYVGITASGEVEREAALFPTGDVVRRDSDGTYHLEARSSRIVKIRGNRVSLDQVEASINSHTAVEESVVLASDDGQSLQILALVRVRSEAVLSPLALRVHCSELLPPYALPARFQIVDLPFPRTSTDKVDRKLTQLAYLQGAINA